MNFANSAVSCKNEVSIRKLVTFSGKMSDRPYSSNTPISFRDNI